MLKKHSEERKSLFDKLILTGKGKIFPWIKQPKAIVGIIFVFLALVTLNRIGKLAFSDNWKQAKGAEYYWIAQSIAGGHGFSFSANHQWLFTDFVSKYPADVYYPTAWEEPIYPYIFGLSMKYFGSDGRLLMLILHVIALYLTAVLIYLIVLKVYNSHLGVIASIWLLMFWPDARVISERNFSPEILAGFSLSLSVFLFLNFFEKRYILRGIIIGCILGISCLIRSTTFAIVPIIIVLTLFYYKFKPIAWYRVLVLTVTFAIVLSPWVIRNYLVFGQLIPFRNGFGQGLYMSNPMVAATFSDRDFAHEDTLGPIWHAGNAEEALKAISTNKEKRLAIYRRAYDCIELEAPKNYNQFNEAQRDKVYLEKSIAFIKDNPKTFLNLTYYRIKMFLIGSQSRYSLVIVLSVIGILLSLKNRKELAIAIAAAGYILTFSLIGSWFDRYRYPIEPILFVLVSGLPVFVFNIIKLKFLKINS